MWKNKIISLYKNVSEYGARFIQDSISPSISRNSCGYSRLLSKDVFVKLVCVVIKELYFSLC